MVHLVLVIIFIIQVKIFAMIIMEDKSQKEFSIFYIVIYKFC